MHSDDHYHLTPNDPGYDPIADLLSVLDLRPTGQMDDLDSPENRTDPGMLGAPFDEFVGRSQPQPHGRIFGGQVVASCIIAAGRTVADVDGPPRHLHSLHGYFLRGGDASAPLRFAVERLRDGASFSQRRVHALQFGRPILSMGLSFQTETGGLDHHSEMPHVAPPEALPSVADLLDHVPESLVKNWAIRRAIDIRHPEGALYLQPAAERVPYQSVWVKTVGPLPDDPLLHAAVIAYASDYTLLESVLRRHGITWADPRLRPASLDHSMWFHRPARADEWILYSQYSPNASGGRGLGVGTMFTRDGTHVATMAQEGMLRIKD